ncbi:MAG: metallophosphoesterase [Edaphocola sp.]
MRIQSGLIISIGAFALLEFYNFVAINVATRQLNGTFRKSILVAYVLLSLAAWMCLLSFRHWDMQKWPPSARVVLVASLLGFLAAKIVVAALLLLNDVGRLLSWVVRHVAALFPHSPKAPVETPKGITRSAFLARMALLVGGLVFSGFLYGTSNRYRYVFKRYKIPLAKLPPAFKGLKIVHISDIHSGSFDNVAAVAHGVDMILKEKPDLILFTGDLVNNVADEIEPYIGTFARLQAPLGVYSTLGNHDYGDYVEWPSAQAKAANLEKLKRHHAAMGWRLLMNEHVLLEKNGEKIALLGVENWSGMARFPKHGDLKKAHAGIPPDVPVKILMSHDPSHWDAQVRPLFSDIDLTLSGHTHGMQLGLRLPWMKWSPVQYAYKQWAGMYQEGHQRLNVNVGYGFLGYPGRLGILPEITVMELV